MGSPASTVISEGQCAFTFYVAESSLMFSVGKKCNSFLSVIVFSRVYCKITVFPFIDEIALLLAVN
jgi:hypothetical protein